MHRYLTNERPYALAGNETVQSSSYKTKTLLQNSENSTKFNLDEKTKL